MPVYMLAGAAALLLTATVPFLRKRFQKSKSGRSDYIDALHLLLENRPDAAMDKLKRTVRNDTGNLMAYIQLGNILRKKGDPARAVKVHKNLLLRTDLKADQINQILKVLIEDYRAAGHLDNAVGVAERLNQRDKKNMETRQTLLRLYESKGDWDKAYFYRHNINKWARKKDQSVLALYKVQSGLAHARNGREHEARNRFKEAVKIDRQCTAAYLYWGDSFNREGQSRDALKIWRDFALAQPQRAHFCLKRLRDILFQLGKYNEFEQLLAQIVKKKPGHPAAFLYLIEIYRKQGIFDKALSLCDDLIDRFPDADTAHHARILLLKDRGDTQRALNEAITLLDTRTRTTVYRCDNCHHESQIPLWHCPQCGSWDTFIEVV